MSRRTDGPAALALALALAAAGCAKPQPLTQDADVGRHRVSWVLPRGWEHLDHGRQHLFRSGEWQLSLIDRGATTPDSSLVFGELGPEPLREYVFRLACDPRRHEIASRTERVIHGAGWVELETWDRVSHMARSRVAYLVHDGALLVLAIDRGPYEQVAPRFEELLSSLELSPGAAVMP